MICNVPNISIQSITADPNFKKFLEYGGYAAEGVETAFQKYADLLKKGLIEPGKEKDAAVKAFADSYQWLSRGHRVRSCLLPPLRTNSPSIKLGGVFEYGKTLAHRVPRRCVSRDFSG